MAVAANCLVPPTVVEVPVGDNVSDVTTGVDPVLGEGLLLPPQALRTSNVRRRPTRRSRNVNRFDSQRFARLTISPRSLIGNAMWDCNFDPFFGLLPAAKLTGNCALLWEHHDPILVASDENK